MESPTLDPVQLPKAGPDALPELSAFLAPFAPLFRRRTSRASMERYVTGLLTDLPHKTAETIAAAAAGTSTERLQHLLADANWDAAALDEARVKRLLARHPPTGGVLVLDDTGLPKKGAAPAGVARQYSGTLGKIGNCQVVVSAEYLADDPASSAPCHWPVSARLYVPEGWAGDAERRRAAHVPAEVEQRSKPEIALTLVDHARRWGAPIETVVADAGYGDNPGFLQGLDERRLPYVCAVERTFGARLPREVQEAAGQRPAYQGRGQPPKPRPAPLHRVDALIAGLPEEAWRTVAWREGSAGVMRAQAVALRVHWATGSPRHSTSHHRVQTGPEGWLLAERPAPTKYWLSSLPPETPLERLLTLAHARWVVEQFYEDAKQECGLADFQGRRWDGLHRHLALVMLAYSFLAVQRLQPASPAGGAFPPLRPAPLAPPRAPAGAALALPRPRALAAPDRSGQGVPPS